MKSVQREVQTRMNNALWVSVGYPFTDLYGPSVEMAVGHAVWIILIRGITDHVWGQIRDTTHG